MKVLEETAQDPGAVWSRANLSRRLRRCLRARRTRHESSPIHQQTTLPSISRLLWMSMLPIKVLCHETRRNQLRKHLKSSRS
ncbi:hypothetical protein E2C01_095980 [Portunus trituberculatus]|uniref:Uncharacterized protein n=1 Tax=Portunus trituberculatus TaxID=210409 RepID=A0A5B7K721_PORTR|nr:hypothetical protein [Portunus trituberculatus]